MTTKHFVLALGLLSVPVIALVTVFSSSLTQTASAQPPNEPDATAVPVEDDMHEFMEYVFQPTYKRLKESMSASEKDNATWKSIKSDSLILAEGGNLLLFRGPESEAKDWDRHATTVRDFGGQLYRAAKKKDDTESQKVYRSMIKNCNDCHQQFAGGDPSLKP